MKVFKTFLLYVGVLAGLCAAVFICCVLSMMLFNAKILGYQYVSYKGQSNGEYLFSNNNFDAIEVNVSKMNVNLFPSEQTTGVKVEYSQGMYGLCKVTNSEWKYDAKIVNNTFKESTTVYKTLVINITEPSGWIVAKDSYINIYLPTDKFAVVKASTSSGKIWFGGSDDKPINISSQLYLDSYKGEINIQSPTAPSMYISNIKGNTNISDTGDTIDSAITFESNAGKLNLYKTLNSRLVVKSSATKTGPYIIAPKVLGDVTFDSPCGKIEIDQIGDETTARDFVVSTRNTKIAIKTLYGKIYASPAGIVDNASIKVNIGSLISSHSVTNSISYLSTGEGAINIDYTDAPIVISTTSGDVNLKNVKQTVAGAINIAVGNNSDVNINYNKDTMSANSIGLIASIKNGNFTVRNIKSLVNIVADESSKGGTMTLDFVEVKGNLSAVNELANVIKSARHKLVMRVNNSKSYRLLIDQNANAACHIGEDSVLGLIQGTEKINQGSSDYAVKADGEFKYQARVNYRESDYGVVGSIKVTSTSGGIYVNGYTPE